jgi:hypothetical protein
MIQCLNRFDMAQQLTLDFGKALKTEGMQLAEDKANVEIENFSFNFLMFLINYAKEHKQFMAEDVRMAYEKQYDFPVNGRSIGGIFAKAARTKIIRSIGKSNVKNPMAHCANAEVWEYILVDEENND